MRRGRLRTAAAGAVVAVCLVGGLAGCTGSPADPPTTTPHPTSAAPSPSPTPTPTPDAATPPERPDMSNVDAETAEAVAVYFLELFPYAAATGDLKDWTALSHPECEFCIEVRDEIEAIFAAGHHSEGGLLHVLEAQTTEVSDAWWLVTVRLRQEPSTTRDFEGRLIEEFSETKTVRMDVAVVPHSGQLVVREVDTTRED